MSSLAEPFAYINIEEYLSGERLSEIKHEYVDGQVFAMAGAKLNHNRIVRNLSSLLWDQMRDLPCEPLTGDMLLKTAENHYRYPDLMVVCDDDSSDDEYVRENPKLIVEVLSRSTRRKDKTEKRSEYLALPGLLEYVLIEQDYAEIEVQRRSNNWQAEYFYLGQDVTLESVEATFSVEDIYQRVDNQDVLSYLEKLAKEKEAEDA